MGHKIKPQVCKGCKIPKGWGEEIVIENNESIEMGFFSHNNITDLDQKFFSMANPYLN